MGHLAHKYDSANSKYKTFFYVEYKMAMHSLANSSLKLFIH